MKLSIIIPVYNEKNTILEVLNKIKIVDIGNIEKEIIIVDDFSTDGTREILKYLKNSNVYYHDKNKGKGSAIITGLQHMTGDTILIQDADLEYNPDEYTSLLKPILENKTKVVYGSRLLGQHKDMYFMHKIGNKILSLITSILYGKKISDMETGYKVFKKEVIDGMKLNATRFDFEPEITAKILKKGYKIYEIPIDFVNPRKFSEGKKITWKDGVRGIYYLIKYRFVN